MGLGGVKQAPYTNAPNLIYMLHEGKYHTPVASVLTVYSFQYSVMQDTPGMLGLSCDQSQARAVKLSQKTAL